MKRERIKVRKKTRISSYEVFKWAALHTIIVMVSLYLVIVIHYRTNCTSVYLPRVEEAVSGGLGSSLGGCVIVWVMF